jgi:stage V sporulation protein R
MNFELEELQKWDDKIKVFVDKYKLNCYPQEFEICDHNEMLGYMAYSGMPSRYGHWSWGKSFERQKTMYDYGVSGLPYEMVINSNPCLAYLMRDNSLLLQILTMAHVYGHNDFFANNFTFTSGTKAQYTIEMFRNHSDRIASYMEDPSIGNEEVESVIDHAHALSYNCSRNLAIPKLTQAEQRRRAWEKAKPAPDPNWEIHPKKEFAPPDLNKVPLEPEEDILGFIAEYNPYLPEWKRDVLRIVESEAKYFMPQIETKIMNEGWASYWHFKILNELELPQGLHMEFLVKHNQVLRPHPGGLNPYHLGFVMWHDIERRWNAGETGMEWHHSDTPSPKDWADENDTPGRKKIFEIRESDRDASFLRRFLTPELMRELNLFQHEKRGKERIVTKVADDESWKDIKENLIKNTGTSGIPVIKVEDADFGKNRILQLKHYHDGRDLQLEYAEQTLRHLQGLWEREVVLETEVSGRRSLIRIAGDALKIERIDKKPQKNP